MYTQLPIAEAVSVSPPVCSTGVEHETSATVNCALPGEVNPFGVANTMAWFQYGSTSAALGSETAKQTVCTAGCGAVAVAVSPALVEGLRPSQPYDYRLVAEDENTTGEPAHGNTLTFTTPPVAPKITCGEPEAFDVGFSSAVLSCSLNPENAITVYRFQYGPCANLDACSARLETAPLESSVYKVTGVMQSATELAPSATYHYRLVAENEHKQTASGSEGSFTTSTAPSPAAVTGSPEGVTATSATLTGGVDPGGAGATYSFRVGVYNSAGTVYSTVTSGKPAPAPPWRVRVSP